jgi:hypothetical protein
MVVVSLHTLTKTWTESQQWEKWLLNCPAGAVIKAYRRYTDYLSHCCGEYLTIADLKGCTLDHSLRGHSLSGWGDMAVSETAHHIVSVVKNQSNSCQQSACFLLYSLNLTWIVRMVLPTFRMSFLQLNFSEKTLRGKPTQWCDGTVIPSPSNNLWRLSIVRGGIWFLLCSFKRAFWRMPEMNERVLETKS